MNSLINLKNAINILLEREQDFVDHSVTSWNLSDLCYHSGQIFAYNLITKEIDFILDN